MDSSDSTWGHQSWKTMKSNLPPRPCSHSQSHRPMGFKISLLVLCFVLWIYIFPKSPSLLFFFLLGSQCYFWWLLFYFSSLDEESSNPSQTAFSCHYSKLPTPLWLHGALCSCGAKRFTERYSVIKYLWGQTAFVSPFYQCFLVSCGHMVVLS